MGIARNMLATLLVVSAYTPMLSSAASLNLKSPETQTTLVELYTSQGCSSCPPAEAWLSRWLQSPDLWREVIPLAYHVSYWNYLGWADPYAQKRFDTRQHNYQKTGYSRSTYTPEFIVNGREWRGWFSRHDLPLSNKKVGVLAADIEDNGFTVTFKPDAQTPENQLLFLNLALLGQGIETDIKRGENRGKRLQHDFVVLEQEALTVANAGENRWTGTLPAIPKSSGATSYAVVFWLTNGSNPTPVQAVAGALPES